MNTEPAQTISTEKQQDNSFVSYINSLHCLDANSDGALAEAQARNPMFHGIRVKHQLAMTFAKSLLNPLENHHFILTGHAGDGKSTIALELYKILINAEDQESLPFGLPKRVDVAERISLIKDLSEWSDADQDAILAEMNDGNHRFVLVSNTGCLLNLFRRQAKMMGKSTIEMENDLLTALDATAGSALITQLGTFYIHNMARMDNIDTAITLLNNLISSPLWDQCSVCFLHERCPIYRNEQLLRRYKDRILRRMRMLLRRTVDYGSRLTMRQMSAHFAYMLTSGLDCRRVANVLQKKQVFPPEQYMFFNRFWGDNGWRPDLKAAQLKSVELILRQDFGTVYSPIMERQLWIRSEAITYDLGIPELTSLFKQTLKVALNSAPALHYEARTQIRRMVFFFHDESTSHLQEMSFVNAFLNSPTSYDYQTWMNDPPLFSKNRSALKDQLFLVLQEQFSGIKLPDGVVGDKTLYITLNRRRCNIRQSAQILLGKIDFNDKFDVKITQYDGVQKLMLMGKDEVQDIKMPLDLPLLDYLFVRKSGGIGSILQTAYIDRLENLKSEILQRCSKVDENDLLLLKLGANNQLLRQRVSVNLSSLEVING